MANDNIKRYLDYDGLAYLINKFNSVIEANEYTTSEALNNLNQKISELTDNTGGFPIIDADITQIDSVYTTTENLNELITPGQYIIDSSKIQYDGDNFVKTLYWLLSVDKVVYDNNESIIQTYYPLSYLSYNWYNIPIGGLLQRFYEGNNTWTDLQVAAPGDVDTTKFVTKNEFDTNINTINTSINNINTSITNVNEEIDDINETIKGLNKTDNDTKCTLATINVADAPAASENEIDVIAKQQIVLTGETGESLETKQPITSVKVVTKKYVEENFIPKSESDSIWEAINSGRVDNISLEKSGIAKAIADEDVNVPYINNKISFTESETGSFVGKFDVISLPTKNYVINNYVSNQTLSTTLNDYVSKDSIIPNILKNGTPQAYGDKDKSLQWYQTSEAITDTNSINYTDICAPSYSDFSETSLLYNINSMVIRGFWSESYFHDIWMSPNSDYIFHRSINNKIAKPWKILLDNENCGKYIKNIVNNNISHIEFKPSSGASDGGFIDFHYGGSTEDFTSRIIEDTSGTITISASTLKVTGNINVGGGVYETSDETLKDFQDSIQVNFEQLKEIPKAYFTFKDDKTGETKIGTSAQKVKEFYPELVSEDENGILSVDYAKLSIVALKAVDELDNRISKLEKLVEQLINN